jgi:pimeloyl-ACP methyl ester carboxylesterase
MPAKTFVLVHGAWHGGWCWRRVADRLEAHGHTVFAPTLTGLCERAHLFNGDIGLSTHVADIVELMKRERLADIVLCGHSYGGAVISGAADQMHEAVASIVYLDAFVPQHGDRLVDLTSEAVRAVILAAAEKGEVALPPRPAAFFNVNEKDRAWVDAMCTPHPIRTMTDRITVTGARDRIGRKAYIRARDYFNPAFESAYVKLKDDPAWRTYLAPCGHDVMVDAPEWLAEKLEEVA